VILAEYVLGDERFVVMVITVLMMSVSGMDIGLV
jgi:hypothetical protein